MAYVLPFIIAMAVTMAGLPLLAKWALRLHLVDQPGSRKVHLAPIPRIGGVAMAAGVLIAAPIAINLDAPDRWFLAAGAILAIFGALDDRFDLDYRSKFLGQLVAVAIVVFAGDVQIHALTLDDRLVLPGPVSLVLTILFLVGITNAVNLADGLDGLAGGTTFMSLCAVALLSSVGDQQNSVGLCLAFAGAVLGFLRFNTYPASVFMGDAGSQLLGFAVGVLSIRATQSTSSQVSSAIPILLLAIPILDTLSVMVYRIGEGRSPFSPDKNHIHHRLLALGLGHHEAVMVIYSMQGTLFIAAYLLRYESDLLILGVVSAFFVLVLSVLQFARRPGPADTPAAPLPAPSTRLSRALDRLQRPGRLPRLSYIAIVISLGVYAGLIVFGTAALSSDVRALILALFALSIALLVFLRAGPLSVAEKAALYVTATILVYLDAVVIAPDPVLSIMTWTTVSVAALATAIRLRLQNDRRFQVTPLDLIVLFMALVVPSLPGTFNLPTGGAWSIAKLLILFYAVEVLVSRAEGRTVWLRVGVVSVLAALAIRPLLTF